MESIIQGAGDAHVARRRSTRGAVRRQPRRRPAPPARELVAPGLPGPLPVPGEPVRLGRDLVTNSQFAMFLDDPVNAGWRRDGSGGAAASRSSSYLRHWWAGSLPDGQRDHPVVYVSPVAAAAFCEWAGRQVGLRLRLPYWHEWARAARAGRNSDAWLREDLTAGRVNCRSTIRALAPVGTLDPNPCGFRDLLGNAFDLCLDPDRSGQVLCCGGAFDTPEGLLLSPEPIAPDECRANVGFRYAVELEPERG
ncbi:MAG TPA: SUMF1/EgtB/PvdO family nonheme iron enzyme [Actinomycetes bacterium]|nr:SUMF1/EgtB/PvdO family nonheme iron enzyme [Actinomycetes bacterium]